MITLGLRRGADLLEGPRMAMLREAAIVDVPQRLAVLSALTGERRRVGYLVHWR